MASTPSTSELIDALANLLWKYEQLERRCLAERGSDDVQRASTRLFNEAFRFFEQHFDRGYIAQFKAAQSNIRPMDYAVIADLDYAADIGDQTIKSCFAASGKDLKENVVDDPTSKDGASLLAEMNHAITTGSMDSLRELWEYIKIRQQRLRTDLDGEDRAALDGFILGQRAASCCILARGTLEAYLPSGYKDKDLDRLIALLDDPAWFARLPEDVTHELSAIVEAVKGAAVAQNQGN